MRSSRDEEWIPDTDHDRDAVLAQLERLIGSASDNEWVLETEQDRQAVLAQLDRMLEDARFRFSDHYPRFLRFVVEATVHGSADRLKERDLGIEVFGRAADYDLNSDPIVRVTAAEIQDRIMKYYGQEEHSAELRIELPYGSCIPRFRQPSPRVARAPERTQADTPRSRQPETRTERVPEPTQPDKTLFRQPSPRVEGVPEPIQPDTTLFRQPGPRVERVPEPAQPDTTLFRQPGPRVERVPEPTQAETTVSRQPGPRAARAPERTQADTPRFRQPSRAERVPEPAQAETMPRSPMIALAETATSPTESEPSSTSGSRGKVRALALVIVALVSVIAFGVATRYRVDAVTSFWQFARDHSSTVMVCVRDVEPNTGKSSSEVAASSSAAAEQEGAVPYSDVIAAAKISSAIASAGLTPVIRPATRTSLNDLQQGPVVMIGGINNDWTIRLTESLPFRFVKRGDSGADEILDVRSATEPVYSIDTSLPYSAVTQDYGIVARFLNPITERPTVIVAGLGANGTEAATSLVTSNNLLMQFVASAPKDWQKRNFEILLATQATGGKAGPPKILAAQYW